MKEQQQGLSVEEAMKKAAYFCSYQERCHKEVLNKLKNLGMFQQAIDHIMVYLIENNYLNEERFARSFARGKHRMSHWGKNRIVQELKLRDISDYAIKKALKEVEEENYEEHFHQVAEKKWQTLNDSILNNKKRKFMDYLIRKGYEYDLIIKKLNELIKNEL
ncbi:regulatory protein RecX [Myroides ceti]|uniref:Regulatory protein RecX n=1 Tax=Paenimyroides ceti TaxID=395087 RepID=A0ABT8CN26_9FLAO|nr:regulatory protein RecX [Paenimyroides ceti]MDN3705599.1 regulatory protein RecX [Paenimyroides ceti]